MTQASGAMRQFHQGNEKAAFAVFVHSDNLKGSGSYGPFASAGRARGWASRRYGCYSKIWREWKIENGPWEYMVQLCAGAAEVQDPDTAPVNPRGVPVL